MSTAASTFNFAGLAMPESLIASLSRYSTEHVATGGFLKAVLENDLCEAVCRADQSNFQLLPVIVRYVYNELPSPCWGSKEKVAAWLAAGRPPCPKCNIPMARTLTVGVVQCSKCMHREDMAVSA